MSRPPTNSHDRAPSHHKPKLPPIADLVATLRAGTPITDLACLYERTPTTLRTKLNNAGYTTLGDPMERPTITEIAPLIPFDAQPWADQAECRRADPELFFPRNGINPNRARLLCVDCPVRTECLTYALTNHEQHGVWGGFSPKQRRALLRTHRQAAS